MKTYSLYIVGTPIGNLSDISKRAIETLQNVDFILCEDTRVSEKLLGSLGIKARLLVYNDHNATSVVPLVIQNILEKNCSYALISDAGMPLVSDPGYKLVQACLKNGVEFTTIPGPSAILSALVLSGLPSDKFIFCGFADHKKFTEIAEINATVIMFESPKRVVGTLQKLSQTFIDRKVAVVREITKIFEECIRGSFAEVLEHFKTYPPKGEIVIVIAPPSTNQRDCLQKYIDLIKQLKGKIPDPELSSILSNYLKISKNSVYNFLKTL